MSENIKIKISETVDVPLKKYDNYWYQKNKSDVPEYVKVIEIHKEGNDYYYTILMRNKTEKQTIGQYLFNWKTPPKYSLLPDDNRDRLGRAYDYGFVQGQFSTNKDDTREWRIEDIIPRNEEDRKRLSCVYRHAWNEAKKDEWKIQKDNIDKFVDNFVDEFNKPYNKTAMAKGRLFNQECNPS